MCSIAFPTESTTATSLTTDENLAATRAARNKANAQHLPYLSA